MFDFQNNTQTMFDNETVFDERFCEKCNTSLSELLETGIVGCANCYKVFEQEIKSNLMQKQGSFVHVGKLALKRNSKLKLSDEIERLEKEKSKAAQEEDFILAESLKNQIEKLKGEL